MCVRRLEASVEIVSWPSLPLAWWELDQRKSDDKGSFCFVLSWAALGCER